MNGIIIVNKEKGISSFFQIKLINRILGCKKIGHAGTLDPLATGVLVVLLNDATKLSDYLINDTKEYEVEITIGIKSDTYDITGNIEEEVKVNKISDVDNVLKSFLGKSMQKPPIYSAIKQQGMKLYEKAREKMDIKVEPREIFIDEICRISDILYVDNKALFSFKVKVSKGTYIRSLCVDIGNKLGYPALMSNLIRLKSGEFRLEDSYSIDDIKSGNFKIINMLDALKRYSIIEVNNEVYKLVLNGRIIEKKLLNTKGELAEDLLVLKYNNNLLAIYEKKDEYYKAKRIWK
ncbi:MAG: tRNA pseudouridine(55) synthase TruB [Bacilli bacterium]|nr:tRNA pseudouridine(55) synthase TruB [Bacilli bacterium]MDD2681485.1 tRNA pseudouridine(55) synthase TruB [Bacilli bacterium]MDD3121874.1 tRNA pseudouridine(55) synthase TruB [Bacilli bacterium]MDD4062924.1 tRNA pseudouridine(55) synthase TruB [Bacilli bacterium]MDD4482282.1 tRNA pseudouridine(55) synthase TruB [Bacilli bacterium]